MVESYDGNVVHIFVYYSGGCPHFLISYSLIVIIYGNIIISKIKNNEISKLTHLLEPSQPTLPTLEDNVIEIVFNVRGLEEFRFGGKQVRLYKDY
jgi:hypothetical protein